MSQPAERVAPAVGEAPVTPTADRVARNASYSLAGGLVAFVAGAASSVVLARLLGPDGLGTYALVLSAGGILAMAATLGVPHAATKYVAEYEARGEHATAGAVLAALARFETVTALVLVGMAVLAAPWLERAFHAPGFTSAFHIAAAGLLPSALAALVLAGLQGFQDYRSVTVVSLVATPLLFSTTLGFLALGAGAAGAVGALALTGAFTALLGGLRLRRHVRVSLRGPALPPAARAKLRRYVPAVSLVLALDAVVWQRSEVFFLGVFRTPREVAWYSLAFGVATTAMRLLPRPVSAVLAPVASGLYGAADRDRMQTLFIQGSRYLAMLAAPLVIGGTVLAGPLLTTVYGEDYGPASAAFPLVLVGAGFGAVGSVTAGIQNGMERQDLVVKVALAATAVNIVLDLALIPSWGVIGAALANAAAQAGAVVAGIALTTPLVGARYPVRDCLRVLAAAGLTGAVAYPVATAVGGGIGLAAGVLAGALVYPVALLATNSLKRDDLQRLEAAQDLLPAPFRHGYRKFLHAAGRWAA